MWNVIAAGATQAAAGVGWAINQRDGSRPVSVDRHTVLRLTVEVPYDEELANRIGPEPCAEARERHGEKPAGDHAGQPLSRQRLQISGADAVAPAEESMRISGVVMPRSPPMTLALPVASALP